MFPSPLGDYVFNLPMILFNKKCRKEFPSPLGDYVFNLAKKARERYCGDLVSVPSRGLCFQSGMEHVYAKDK